jgi:hypothetical protein
LRDRGIIADPDQYIFTCMTAVFEKTVNKVKFFHWPNCARVCEASLLPYRGHH